MDALLVGKRSLAVQPVTSRHLAVIRRIDESGAVCQPERVELLQDFVNLQQLIGSVEVNLVPLQDNIFTNCKSELKYFEAGVTGTVTIASPSFTLARAIEDGENGYIARSFEWHEKLEYVLDNMDSYAVMAEKAFLHSEENYCWENQVDRIEATLFG